MDYNHPYIKSLISNYEHQKTLTDKVTNELVVAYSAINNLMGIHRILTAIKEDPDLKNDWDQLVVRAKLQFNVSLEDMYDKIKYDPSSGPEQRDRG